MGYQAEATEKRRGIGGTYRMCLPLVPATHASLVQTLQCQEPLGL